MATYKCVQVSEANGPFEIVERPKPKPGSLEVLIKVEACGVCHSDVFTKTASYPGITFPRVPGHEVIGIIEEIGEGVRQWKKGQRVGVGWHGGHCFQCNSCRRGRFLGCENSKITGITTDGGYGEYLCIGHEALAEVPEGLDPKEAAPLLCAGITTFNALRNSGAPAGSVVAIQGIGGLGHYGIQFAAKLGFNVVAISTSDAKKELATKLGAHHYIDTSKQNEIEELQKLGGARIILATAPSSKSVSEIAPGLGPEGKILVVGVDGDQIQVSPFLLVGKSAAIQGWASGIPIDSEETLKFSELTGIKSMIETFPLLEPGKAQEGYDRCMTNGARFRVVFTL